MDSNIIFKIKNENSDGINGNGNNNNDVAIIGIGIRIPGDSKNLNLFFKNLENKFDGIVDATSGEFPRWSKNHCEIGDVKSNNLGMIDINHWKEFDPLFFGLNPTDIPLVDPQQRLTLKCTWEALENAMIDPKKLRGTNTSVFIGCSTLDYQNGLYDHTTTSTTTGSHNNFISNMHSISNRISYCFDFRGTSLTLDTACSSSGNAIHLGYQSIVNGTSDHSIVGGTNLIVDPNGLNKTETYLNMLGASGHCNAFDSSADGFVRAEGCGVFVLKRLSKAINDGDSIYCVIKGTNSNEDGSFNKSNFFAPSKDSQCENIKLALKSANLNASDINYIETHGTGTPVGDPIETEAISMALCKDRRTTNGSPLLIGSVKTNVGHLEAASAVPSLAKCCLMFKHRQFLPNRSLVNPNPNIKFDEWKLKVVTDSIPFPTLNTNKPVIMALNNFGVTGSNVCLLLSEYIGYSNNNGNSSLPQTSIVETTQQYLIPFSANSKTSLDKYRKEITLLSPSTEKLQFKDLVYHQIYSKSQFYQRSVIVANNWDQLKSENQLISTTNNKSFNMISPLPSSNPPIIFVFSGQGPQYIQMGLQLCNSNSLFKQFMNSIDKSLEKYFGYSNLEKLRSISPDDKKSIHLPIIAQPTIFIIQLSLFKLFKHWGIHPSIIVGHSFGELTAALCSNMISYETACFLVFKRATFQNLTIGSGKMLSINISANEFNETYQKQYPSIEISCFNSPSSIVIGGNEQQLLEISNSLKLKDIFSAFLGTDSSFHTKSQKEIKNQMIGVGNFITNPPNIPTFSTVSGKLFSLSSLFDINYLYQNVRKPVLFQQAVENILNYIQIQNLGTNPIFLELSPHPTLAYYMKQMIPKNSSYFNASGESSIQVFTTLNRNKIDNEEINKTISQIYCNGYSVDFKSQFNNNSGDIKEIKSYKLKLNQNLLPTYQWDEEEFWQESENSKQQRVNGPSVDCLGNSNADSLFKSMTSFIDINKKPFSYLKGHQVRGKYYFPGTGYIDNLIKIFPSQDFNIQYLEFKVPFVFVEGQIGCLHSNIFQTSKTEFKSNFSFKDNKTNGWVLGSTGKLQLLNSNTTSGKKYDIKELKLKCDYSTVLKSELYEHIKAKSGLTYSGSFQRVEECSFGENCSLVKVSLHNPLINLNDINTFFNPSILDCCLHGCIALSGSDYSQLVFDRVEDYKVYQSNIPKDKTSINHVYVYSKFIGKIGDSYHSSATIMLEDGTLLIQADKLVVTSLIPILDQSKIENPTNQLYSFYLQSKDSILSTPQPTSLNHSSELSGYIKSIIYDSIKPLVNEKLVFRILDLSFSNNIQNKIMDVINSLLTNDHQKENYEIDIEYTISHTTKLSLKEVKDKLSISNFTQSSSLLFKEIKNNQDFNLKPSYYDIIIYLGGCFDDEINQDDSFILNEIFKVLSPKGYFIYNISHSTNNNKEILMNIGYETVISILNNNNTYHCQKPSVFNHDIKPSKQPITLNYDQVIIYRDLKEDSNGSTIISNSFNDLLLKHYNNVKEISNINQFSNIIRNNSLIYFTKTINELKMNTFIQITMEYINMNQILIKNGFVGCKLILISTYSCSGSNNSKYYLNSSVLGAFKYFSEVPTLNLYSLDFDDQSIQEPGEKIINNIESLSLCDNHNQKEFIIRNNIPYHERVKRESNISKKYKSTSFVGDNSHDALLVKLNPNLEYELTSKDLIESNHVEIKVMAAGINFKDNLIYRGLVPPELRSSKGDPNNPEFGLECSGIITGVGKNVTEFKIGDSVFAMTPNSTSSHTYSHVDRVCHKPNNISFVEAASMVTVYATCLHSIFNVGHLDIHDESILIHSATGGVGLAALNLLKWKGFKSNLFVTVGSKEKEQFLLDNYGSMITKIFSTRNTDYSDEIKSVYGGVDLILNTLGIEFMDSNFKCLSSNCSRIIDLSVTYLNPNEYTDLNKFKYNIGYHAVELTRIPTRMLKKLLISIADAISNQQIKPIPIKEYSIDKIKDAIEHINERKHIGKIVVNMSDINEKVLSNLFTSNYSIGNDNNIVSPSYCINENILGNTVLVTGQTGLILEIIKWIIKYSTTVKDIIILSRSTLKWELEFLINQTNSNKPNQFRFHYKSLDIGDYKSIENSIDEIKEINQVDSIFHFAAAYTTSDSHDVNMKQLELSSSAKSIGAVNLHILSISKGWKLKQFVMASSMASVFGAPRQCCYIASNNVLDALSNYRKSIGLASTTVNWGPFETTGVVSKTTAIAKFLEGNGFNSISINTFLGSLDLLLQNTDKQSNAMVVRINDSITTSGYPFINKIDYFANSMEQNNHNSSSDQHQESSVRDQIVQRLADALSIQTIKINYDIRLVDYGADSLIIVQLKNWLDKNFIPNLFTIAQLQKMTIGNLIQNVIKALNNSSSNNNNVNNSSSTSNTGTALDQKYSTEFWKNEIKFNESIKPKQPFSTHDLEVEDLVILLTGATGFLGAYNLVDFITKSNCKSVYCLVRNRPTIDKAMNAILDNLKYHLLFDKLNQQHLTKIIPVMGDLSEPMFGLDENQYLHLSKNVNLIAHVGADTNFVAPYSETRLTNVVSSIEMIKFACLESITKKVAYISTFGVLAFIDDIKELQVLPSIEHLNTVTVGYAQSKIISEYIMDEAASRGIPSMVIRPPVVFANPNTGIGNTNDAIQLIIQCSFALKSYPEDLINQWNNAPVDWVSENMVNIMINNKCWSNNDFSASIYDPSSHQFTSSSSNNNDKSTPLMLYNVIGLVTPTIDIIKLMTNEYSLKPLKFNEWKIKLDQSKQECCIRMNTFHRIFTEKLILSNDFNASDKTIQLLESMGSNFNDSIITLNTLKNHINHHFKLY